MMLQIDQVTKKYRGPSAVVTALDGVSLQVETGSFIAIRGPSGCGKSTLLLTAGTLLSPDQGEVQIVGELPYRMNSDDRARFRARQIGFVFQQFHLVPYLSVLDNVLAPTLALQQLSGDGITSETRRYASELLKRFGLEHRSDHTTTQLSSGERQRCALARALLNRPKILLADEPTGNLDPENAKVVLNYLRAFAEDGGTVLLVTHDDKAASVADKTLWMHQGQLSESEVVSSHDS